MPARSDAEAFLFTFVTEVAGSTVIEQARGADVVTAVLAWELISTIRPRSYRDVLPVDATAVLTVTNVWCIFGTTIDGDTYMSHVIATSDARFPETRMLPLKTRKPSNRDKSRR